MTNSLRAGLTRKYQRLIILVAEIYRFYARRQIDLVDDDMRARVQYLRYHFGYIGDFDPESH